MASDPKFAFYEKVRCISESPEYAEIAGKLAAVLGRAQNDDGSWVYAIHVYDHPTCYSVSESDLVSTGQHAKRSDLFSGDSIRVSQDGELLG